MRTVLFAFALLALAACDSAGVDPAPVPPAFGATVTDASGVRAIAGITTLQGNDDAVPELGGVATAFRLEAEGAPDVLTFLGLTRSGVEERTYAVSFVGTAEDFGGIGAPFVVTYDADGDGPGVERYPQPLAGSVTFEAVSDTALVGRLDIPFLDGGDLGAPDAVPAVRVEGTFTVDLRDAGGA